MGITFSLNAVFTFSHFSGFLARYVTRPSNAIIPAALSTFVTNPTLPLIGFFNILGGLDVSAFDNCSTAFFPNSPIFTYLTLSLKSPVAFFLVPILPNIPDINDDLFLLGVVFLLSLGVIFLLSLGVIFLLLGIVFSDLISLILSFTPSPTSLILVPILPNIPDINDDLFSLGSVFSLALGIVFSFFLSPFGGATFITFAACLGRASIFVGMFDFIVLRIFRCSALYSFSNLSFITLSETNISFMVTPLRNCFQLDARVTSFIHFNIFRCCAANAFPLRSVSSALIPVRSVILIGEVLNFMAPTPASILEVAISRVADTLSRISFPRAVSDFRTSMSRASILIPLSSILATILFSYQIVGPCPPPSFLRASSAFSFI